MAVPTKQEIILGCIYCDAEFRGAAKDAVKAGWYDVGFVGLSDNPLDWYTHLGHCPDCHQAEAKRIKQSSKAKAKKKKPSRK